MSEQKMKNIMIIDWADNCTFSVFQATEEEFKSIFPEPGQEIQFQENLGKIRKYKDERKKAFAKLWERPIRRRDTVGIHGILFYENLRYKKHYLSLREDGMSESAYNPAQRALFGLPEPSRCYDSSEDTD
jgi:hypothetical protein